MLTRRPVAAFRTLPTPTSLKSRLQQAAAALTLLGIATIDTTRPELAARQSLFAAVGVVVQKF